MELTAALILVASLFELAGAQYSVESVTLSKQRARVGDDVGAVCEVRNDANTRILVYWVRKVHDHDQEVEISANGILNDDFKDSRRYGSKYAQVSPDSIQRVRFFLNITDVQTKDSGNIGCRLTGPENERFEVFKDFIVSVPVQTVTWMTSEVNSTKPSHVHSNGSTVEMTEGHVKRFVCHVNGSFPKPDVRVYIGDEDITSRFEHRTVLVKGGGPPGLQPLYYKVDMINDALTVDYSFNNKLLRCVASLRQADVPSTVDAAAMQKMASVDISLLYKPKFLCGMEVFTKLNEPNYNLICKVHANPSVIDAKVWWIDDENDVGNDTRDILEDGMQSEDYSAKVNSTDLETEITLTIYRVFKQHFRTYVFEAENDLGKVRHEIELKEEDMHSVQSAVNAVNMAASSLVFGITNLVASMFLSNLLSEW